MVADGSVPAAFAAADLAGPGGARPRRAPRSSSRGTRPCSTRRRRRVERARRRRSAPRRDPVDTLRTGGRVRPGRRCRRSDRRRRTSSPRSTSSCSPPTPTRCSARCATPARCSSARGRRPRSATTSPASTTCCPTGGTARASRSALRVDDFRKHVHVVRATRGRAGRAGAVRPRHRARPRGSTRTPRRSSCASRCAQDAR